MPQFNSPSTFMSSHDTQNPGRPSDVISIRTDVPQPRHYANIMNSDVPDLTYDYDYDCDFATPHSASSSHMIATPVFDWTMPLGDEALGGKVDYSPLLKDWPSCSSHFSSPSISRDQCALDGLDELNWEKQTFSCTEISPVFTNNPPSCPATLQPNAFQHSQQSNHTFEHAYPSPSNDTPSTSFVQYPPHTSQPSTSASVCTTISPSALNSASTSPQIQARLQAVPQPPLKLHQPRPSRRIPIISLARLASASEGMLEQQQPRSRPPLHSKGTATLDHFHSNGPYPRSPGEALSPLPLDCHGFSPVSEKREIGHLSTSHMNSYEPPQLPNSALSARFLQRGFPTKVISCSCGCMESYTIR